MTETQTAPVDTAWQSSSGGANSARQSSARRFDRDRARTTNRPLSRHDGNTAEGRRVRDLFRSFIVLQRLGDPTDPAIQAQVLEAVELTQQAEYARTLLFKGVTIEQLVLIQNLAHRAVRRLRLPTAGQNRGPTLIDLVARHAAQPPDPPEPDEEAEVERLAVAAELIADLGHSPDAREAAAIEAISAATIESRSLRRRGLRSAEQNRLVLRGLRDLGLASGKNRPRRTHPRQEAERAKAARNAQQRLEEMYKSAPTPEPTDG
jgi:hypothetical protein